MRHLDTPQQVTLGDGSSLELPADGTVKLDINSVNATEKSNEMLWYRRYGHVGEQNLGTR